MATGAFGTGDGGGLYRAGSAGIGSQVGLEAARGNVAPHMKLDEDSMFCIKLAKWQLKFKRKSEICIQAIFLL